MTDINELESLVNLEVLQQLQDATGRQFRPRVAPILAAAVNKRIPGYPHFPIIAEADSRAETLDREGYLDLGSVLSSDQAGGITSFLRTRPCFNAHTVTGSDRQPRRIGEGAENFHYGSHALEDVIAAPHLLELANRPEYLAIVERFLGCTPTLYSVHAWWSFPGHGQAQVAQRFHIDPDDYKFCTLFVYLTDVDQGSGPHQYIRRSQNLQEMESVFREYYKRHGPGEHPAALYDDQHGQAHDPLYEDVLKELITTITGPAGSAFLVDTSGLHRGLPVIERPRLMFWARYGLYRCLGEKYVENKPVSRAEVGNRIPATALSAYINRCIVTG